MNKILSQTRTYSHDNGLGVPHSHLYEYEVNSTLYECVNGKVVQNNGKDSIFVGNAYNKKNFAYIIKKKESGHVGVVEVEKPNTNKKQQTLDGAKFTKVERESNHPGWSKAIIATNKTKNEIIEFETLQLATKHSGYKNASSLSKMIREGRERNGWSYKYKNKNKKK